MGVSETTAERVPIPTIALVLGRLPSGLFVLTTRTEQQETGMLVSWVMQAGFVPPAVTVAIRNDRYVGHWLTDGCPFVLNLLARGEPRLLRYFARGFAPDEKPFSGLDVERSASGIAVLRDALGYLECEPQGFVDSRDHRIFLADVTGGRLVTTRTPIVHIRHSGMNY